jgi:hypothetical protein
MLALAACNDGEIDKLPEAQVQFDELQGAWGYCYFDGTDDWSETLIFDGVGNFQVHSASYSSITGTCDAGKSPNPTQYLVYETGGKVSATLSGVAVTANVFDYGPSPGPLIAFIIYYIDKAASPDALYFGFGSPPNDGSSPALRPTVVGPSPVYRRQ